MSQMMSGGIFSYLKLEKICMFVECLSRWSRGVVKTRNTPIILTGGLWISSLLFLVKLYSSVEIKFLKLDAKMFDGTVRVEMKEDPLVEYLALPFF